MGRMSANVNVGTSRGGGMLKLSYDDAGTRKAAAGLRRDIQREIRAAGREVARERCLPAARAAAPSIYRDLIRPKATNSGVGVTIGGRRGGASPREIAGYLEFGGTLRAKRKRYLTFKVGEEWVRVRHVSIPRDKQGRYVGRVMQSPAMVHAVHAAMEREITQILDRHLARSGARVG